MLRVGGATTVRLAVEVLPVPPLLELTVTVLVLTPAVVPVTLTEKVQEAPTASVAPDRLTEPDPATAVIVPPPQPPTTLGGVATTIPAGRVSVKPMPVSVAELLAGLVMVKVNVEVPPNGMLVGENALTIVGGPTTVNIAVLLVPPGPLSFELMLPVVLLFTPTVVPVMFRLIVHDPPAANAPPLRLIVVLPGEAGKLPPQLLMTFAGLATWRPEGRMSVNATPLKLSDAFGLLIVKVKLVVPPSGMLEAPNAFVIVGGEATVSVAIAVFPVPPLVELT